jgi:hypothetical protein
VLGYAQTSQAQSFRFKNQVFWGEAAIGASLGSVNMEVEQAGHKLATILSGR